MNTTNKRFSFREMEFIAVELALRLDGYDESTIKQVFNRQNDVKCEPEPSADLARS